MNDVLDAGETYHKVPPYREVNPYEVLPSSSGTNAHQGFTKQQSIQEIRKKYTGQTSTINLNEGTSTKPVGSKSFIDKYSSQSVRGASRGAYK
jgi:hypothetical protein